MSEPIVNVSMELEGRKRLIVETLKVIFVEILLQELCKTMRVRG